MSTFIYRREWIIKTHTKKKSTLFYTQVVLELRKNTCPFFIWILPSLAIASTCAWVILTRCMPGLMVGCCCDLLADAAGLYWAFGLAVCWLFGGADDDGVGVGLAMGVLGGVGGVWGRVAGTTFLRVTPVGNFLKFTLVKTGLVSDDDGFGASIGLDGGEAFMAFCSCCSSFCWAIGTCLMGDTFLVGEMDILRSVEASGFDGVPDFLAGTVDVDFLSAAGWFGCAVLGSSLLMTSTNSNS